MIILADIGGTFARFACVSEDGPVQIKKYEAADFGGLEEALERYCTDCDLKTNGRLRIATAGYETGGTWKFVNRNKWIIDPQALQKARWDTEIILNDFEAAVWALTDLQENEFQVLKEGQKNGGSLCLLGPGTGLGLGYLHHADKPFVQKTHGGHIPAAGVTEEQTATIKEFQKTQETCVVYENLASGPGLEKLQTLYDDKTSLRLFHEFLGLFAATVVVSGHAYGGLYLTGGVLERLKEDKLFNTGHFMEFFHVNAVDSVRQDLLDTPIIHITQPYPALKGLMHV